MWKVKIQQRYFLCAVTKRINMISVAAKKKTMPIQGYGNSPHPHFAY